MRREMLPAKLSIAIKHALGLAALVAVSVFCAFEVARHSPLVDGRADDPTYVPTGASGVLRVDPSDAWARVANEFDGSVKLTNSDDITVVTAAATSSAYLGSFPADCSSGACVGTSITAEAHSYRSFAADGAAFGAHIDPTATINISPTSGYSRIVIPHGWKRVKSGDGGDTYARSTE